MQNAPTQTTAPFDTPSLTDPSRDAGRRRRGALTLQSGGPGLLSPQIAKSGYVPRNEIVDAIFNRGLALLMMPFVLPTIAMLALLVRLGTGGPAFYTGARVGRGGRIFSIYKMRTLALDASARVAGRTLPHRSGLETGVGSYLRKSRLDELPQVLNVLKGDMVFFGPRPVRPEMLSVYRAEVDSLDVRFDVRPGLVGFSQALMPHSASKRLRGRYVSMCCRAPVRYGFVLSFVFGVGLRVCLRSLSQVGQAMRDGVSPTGRHRFLRSGFVKPLDTRVAIEDAEGEFAEGAVSGISDEVVQFLITRPIAPGQVSLELSRRDARGRMVRVTLAAQVETVLPLGVGRSGFVAYATYAPRSSYHAYRIERYFLDQSVLVA